MGFAQFYDRGWNMEQKIDKVELSIRTAMVAVFGMYTV